MNDRAFVLDASALLALILLEPGGDQVAARLEDACISAVNLSEVFTKLLDRGSSAEEVREALLDLDLDIRIFDVNQARLAGELRQVTRASGLSLGDRACLALAGTLGAVAITTDTAWTRCDCGIPIELAR